MSEPVKLSAEERDRIDRLLRAGWEMTPAESLAAARYIAYLERRLQAKDELLRRAAFSLDQVDEHRGHRMFVRTCRDLARELREEAS